jgi:dUTP pyrophosphatase
MHSKFYIKRLTPDALLPKKGSVGAAGYDICASEPTVVPAGGKAKVSTGLSWMLPHNTYGRIAPRSGLAWKNSISVGAGVIDEDYRGEICVILFNHGKEDFEIKKHDRIAQVIVEKIEPTELEEVNELKETERGEGGFGSTGVSQ